MQFGNRNCRMIDFYDIWALSETFDIYLSELVKAIERRFKRLRTRWTCYVPDAIYTDSERARLRPVPIPIRAICSAPGLTGTVYPHRWIGGD